MITKKVNRYYCEFCKKSGQSAAHIKRHETSCTLNPNRVCRVCKMTWGDHETRNQKSVAELAARLPHFNPNHWDDVSDCLDENEDIKLIEANMPGLRESCGDCPACILAALRQSGIRVPLVKSFNFSEEMKSIWADINESQIESDMHAPCY